MLTFWFKISLVVPASLETIERALDKFLEMKIIEKSKSVEIVYKVIASND